MSTTQSDVSSSGRSWSCGRNRMSGSGCPQRWSGINIGAMVVGFVFFWPVGLVVLAWIMTGRDARDLPAAVKALWRQFFGGEGIGSSSVSGTQNVVFDEYQQTQYDRIREIKNEIRERTKRFKEFSSNAKRRADQAEFDNFMANAPGDDNDRTV